MCHHLEKCKLCRHFLLFPDFALIDYHLDKVQTPQAFYDTHQPPWFHISYSAGPCFFVGYILTIWYIQEKMWNYILNHKGWKHSVKNHSTDDDDTYHHDDKGEVNRGDKRLPNDILPTLPWLPLHLYIIVCIACTTKSYCKNAFYTCLGHALQVLRSFRLFHDFLCTQYASQMMHCKYAFTHVALP